MDRSAFGNRALPVVVALPGFLFVVLLASVARTSAEPLKLDPAKPLELVCQTQATQVAPEARVTAGKFRVKLDASGTLKDGAAGIWQPVERDTTHLGSIAERHREACKDGCPMFTTTDGTAFELWVPRRTAIDQVAPGELLTVAVVNAATGKLKASTFLDQQIASLEQGDCELAP